MSTIVQEAVSSAAPGLSHYNRTYVAGGRFFSFAHQWHMALSFEPRHIVEIGVGPGLTKSVLEHFDLIVTTIDIQPELAPDLVGSVLDLPVNEGFCDVAICCQVLEHLPFDDFKLALSELARVSRKGVVLGLPNCSPHYEVNLSLPILPPIKFSGTRRRDPGPVWKAERAQIGHHWEIGYDGFEASAIRDAIAAAGLRIVEDHRVPEKPYHHLFKLVRDEGSA